MKTTDKVKYVICPGLVTSQTDGQIHYIEAAALMRLYRVNPEECVVYKPEDWWPRSYYLQANERVKGLIRLEPRYDGNYDLPESVE